ncbi:unnamed protein product [Fraxinus pennsylvanica]|uniref:DUF7795 domain-containing protein n=1 Tax=Fraxinus pennsylvanica TaxID=56036 RepID=A0AAD1ZCU9_9LAMI|nr:unnamed protein product [Fraxinus pennsylvanica]
MEDKEYRQNRESKEKIIQIFSDFMTRITMFEELVDAGSKLLVGFQQALARGVVSELECLLHDASGAIQTANENWPLFQGEHSNGNLDSYLAMYENERIVRSLNLKSSPGELESYCLMWSLRPFVDDDIIREAWSLVQ